jgi:hypothetical protein
LIFRERNEEVLEENGAALFCRKYAESSQKNSE